MKKYFLILLLPAIILSLSCGEQNATTNNPAEDSAHIQRLSADTVNNPSLVTDQSGTLLLTAENGRALGPAIKYMPEWKAFGWFTSKDSIEWEVDVKDAGEYKAELEWSVSDEEAGKEFILSAGGKQISGKVDKTGSWETYKKKDIGTIDLPAGKQKIVFRSKTNFPDSSGLMDLRQIKLEK
jgi:hypothetical protein